MQVAVVVGDGEIGNIVSDTTYCINWSVLRVAAENEDVCGDVSVVANFRDQVLIAVIDGLGHGEQAYRASCRARDLLKEYSGQSLISLVNKCHEELKRTRGVVMSLAVIDNWEQTMTWIGVGNVEGILYRAGDVGKSDSYRNINSEHILLRGGVVGYQLPMLKASMVSIQSGDLLVFSTDGVKEDYRKDVKVKGRTESIVKEIAAKHIDQSDDALVMVARYAGVEKK